MSEETQILIDPRKVEEAFATVLWTKEELSTAEKDEKGVPKGTVIVEGIMNTFGFHPERLEAQRAQVIAWLRALPHQFHKNTGSGWSFLNACMQENGEQWTGVHRTMDNLFSLGIGLGLVQSAMPREMWGMLPGGMPYYVIDIPEEKTMEEKLEEMVAAVRAVPPEEAFYQD